MRSSVFTVLCLALLIGCSSTKEPSGLLGIKFGTPYTEVEISMKQKGFDRYFEAPNEQGIVFNNGKCFGYDVDVVFMTMDDSKKLTQCIISFNKNILNELSEAVISKYKKKPKIERTDKAVNHVWLFSTCEFRLASDGKQTFLMATNKTNNYNIKSDL